MSFANDLERSQSTKETDLTVSHVRAKWSRFRIVTLLLLVFLVGFLGYQLELVLPVRPPSLTNTYTPSTQSPPSSVGSYDVLGKVVSQSEADQLLQTEAGRQQLSSDNGAVEVTPALINLGRDAFYRETFGNERFLTDVVGSLNGPINLVTITKAIAHLGGKHTANLQVPVNHEITIGGREFKAGTLLNTGLDVPARSLCSLFA